MANLAGHLWKLHTLQVSSSISLMQGAKTLVHASVVPAPNMRMCWTNPPIRYARRTERPRAKNE